MWTVCQTDVDSSPLEEKDKHFRIFEEQIIMNTMRNLLFLWWSFEFLHFEYNFCQVLNLT